MSQSEQSPKRFSSIEELSAKITKAITQPVAIEYSDPDTEASDGKTRFLNFKQPKSKPILTGADADQADPATEGSAWLTILDGPGTGTRFPVDKPFMNIGRGDSQDVRIDFGDDSISRLGHASIAYYGEETGFVIRDGLKPNPVFLNDTVLRGEHDLQNGDRIRIGETVLRFKRT